ncbi:MAG: exopolyphosphatase [Actinomycetaceae bacterium]|nr:exopolyphosphatase [Actinomycetaceae bacterium]MDU0970697.1 exopolyphosphatase [Actinomycetaceae bacterium]
MTTVAAIDCGTNSARLLIAPVEGNRLGAPIAREMTITRLGQGVDKTGQLHPDALERTRVAMRGYADQISDAGVDAVRVVATSASRDASNAQDFVDLVTDIIGVAPEVVSGEEEATLSFQGALAGLGDDVDKPVLLVDIGGGSTEFVRGTDDVAAAYSTNMGSVRVFERFFADVPSEDGSMDPRTPALARAIRDAVAFIDSQIDLADSHVEFSAARTLVGVAGTVTTVTAHALGLDAYDPDAIDGANLPVTTIYRSCNWMQMATVAERRALGFMPAGRADVIGAGALVWQRIIERMGQAQLERSRNLDRILTVEHDILDGIALSLIDR